MQSAQDVDALVVKLGTPARAAVLDHEGFVTSVRQFKHRGFDDETRRHAEYQDLAHAVFLQQLLQTGAGKRQDPGVMEHGFTRSGRGIVMKCGAPVPRKNTPSDNAARNNGALLITPGWLRSVLPATWITAAPASRAYLKTR